MFCTYSIVYPLKGGKKQAMKRQFYGCNIKNFAFRIFQWYKCSDNDKHHHGHHHHHCDDGWDDGWDDNFMDLLAEDLPDVLAFEDEDIQVKISNK